MLGCFIKGAPRSASKLSIDPINSHASYIGKIAGSNKISVRINRTLEPESYFVIKTHYADIFDFLWQPASNVLSQPSLFWKVNFFVQLLYKAFLFESVNIVYDIIYFYKNTLVYIIATLVAHIGASLLAYS